MPLVQLPNGQEVDVPDELTPEQKSAFAAKVQAMPKPDKPGVLSTLGSGLADIGRGALKSIGGMLEGAAAFNSADRPNFKPSPKTDPRSSAEMVESVLPTPQGDSSLRRYVRAGLEGGGGALVSGPLAATSLTAGVAGGLGGEAGSRIDQSTPIGRVVGSLVGAVGGGTAVAQASRLRPQSANLAKEALEGFTPEQLTKAQDYMKKLKVGNVDIDLAQALEATSGTSGNLGAIRDTIARSSQGNEVQRTLRGQPQALKLQAEFAETGLPGTNFGPAQNANNLQETATQRLKNEMQSRSSSVKDAYGKAGQLPDGSREALIKQVEDLINQPGAADILKARGAKLLDRLGGIDDAAQTGLVQARKDLAAAATPAQRVQAQENLRLANQAANGNLGKPLQAADVDTWLGEFRGKYNAGLPLQQADPKGLGQLKNAAGLLNETFRKQSPEIAQADDLFQAITRDKVNPLKQGPVGTINQPRGYTDDQQAQLSKIGVLLERGTNRGAKNSDISTTVSELGKVDPGAFESSFKGWLSDKIAKASSAGTLDNPLGQDAGFVGKLETSLFSNELQYQGMKDAVAGMAKLRNQDPTDLVRGLENLRQMTKAMGSRPGGSVGLSREDIARIGGNSTTADFMRLASMFPVNKAAGGLERAVLGKTLRDFDNILTSPEGAQLLQDLGRTPVMSKKALVLLGTYGGTVGNSRVLSNDNPTE